MEVPKTPHGWRRRLLDLQQEDPMSAFRYCVLVSAALLLAVPGVQSARAEYPDKAIRIVVAYPAGGATDVITRLIGARLSERLKVAVVVENKPGASGMIGSEFVAKSAPDGYTFIYTAADTHSINPHVYAKIAYDARRDFTPVALAGYNPFALVVRPGLPATNVAEFIKLAREQPGKLTFASWGVGSSGHAGMEMFNGATKIQLLHVPFQGAAPAIAAVMGGQVDSMMVPLTLAESNHRAGKARILAVATPKRSAGAPDVPTLTEQGITLAIAPWQGLLGPANLPAPVVTLINYETNAVLSDPQMREQLLKNGLEVSTGSPQEFKALLDSEYERWGKTIREANIKAE
jgi:tripartite-type tricarboxylate transporter receptor subunit TctC